MKNTKEANRYAKALVRNVELEQVPQAIADLVTINDMMVKSRDFKNLLVNPLFTPDERATVIKSLSAKLQFSGYIEKFILHLSVVGVITALPDVIRTATNLYLEKKKKAKAVVMTPIPVSKEQENILKTSLKKVSDREVEIEYVIDPSLLGGILVKIGDTMYDTSIKGQLRLLKDELIKG